MTKKELIDYTSMLPKDFWDLVTKQADIAQKRVDQLFYLAGTSETLSEDKAIECLNYLFIDSHRRLREYCPELVEFYPSKHILFNSLQIIDDLWIVDHTTSNISNTSVLDWYSNNKSVDGFSSHFLVGYRGLPFYLIPLMHGAIHEPHRDSDAISISMMNAGGLSKDKGCWKFWGGALPQTMVIDMPPVRLPTPQKGYLALQTFTTTQIKNNIRLKRLIISALRRKLDISRFTQHTDWDNSHLDMGPLWPTNSCNDAAYENIPVDEYDFIQRYDAELSAKSLEEVNQSPIMNSQNPEYKTSELGTIPTIRDIQLALCKAGIKIDVDNKFNTTTKIAIQKFQQNWNRLHAADQLDISGIPNIRTCKRLFNNLPGDDRGNN